MVDALSTFRESVSDQTIAPHASGSPFGLWMTRERPTTFAIPCSLITLSTWSTSHLPFEHVNGLIWPTNRLARCFSWLFKIYLLANFKLLTIQMGHCKDWTDPLSNHSFVLFFPIGEHAMVALCLPSYFAVLVSLSWSLLDHHMMSIQM